MIDLNSSRFCVLFLSGMTLCSAIWPVVSSAQSDTTEVRASDLGGPQPQQFDERQVEAEIQWVQQNNPQLWQILVQWETTTKGYQKLSGTHRRFVYDSVFQNEKRSDGKFYYEAPDKGRIDIYPIEIPEGSKSQKLSPQGKPYSLTSDMEEIWICDGKRIAQGAENGAEKIYTIFPIPPMNQGVNIMDGPLPFLFGLPARQAVQRYDLTLLPNTDEKLVWLKILPKRQQDKENWKEAEVILDRKTYLPLAVKLQDKAGTTETVYSFADLKVNGNVILNLIFDRDPFNIEKVMKDAKYQKVLQNVRQNNQPPGKMNQPGPPPQENRPETTSNVAEGNKPPLKLIMPNVVNGDWKFVQKVFTEKGFQPEFRKAGPAPSAEQVYKVAKQEPPAGTELTTGQKVIFYLYEEVQAAGKP